MFPSASPVLFSFLLLHITRVPSRAAVSINSTRRTAVPTPAATGIIAFMDGCAAVVGAGGTVVGADVRTVIEGDATHVEDASASMGVDSEGVGVVTVNKVIRGLPTRTRLVEVSNSIVKIELSLHASGICLIYEVVELSVAMRREEL